MGWKDKVDNELKKEVQKIKEQTRAKIQKSKGNKSNEIVPEIAHLIENNKGSSTTTQMDTASVTVTTFDNLSDLAAPRERRRPRRMRRRRTAVRRNQRRR